MAFRRFRAVRPVPRGIKSVFGRGKPSIASGQLKFTWNGRKKILELTDAVQRALDRAQEEANDYWFNVVWNPVRHPNMTGRERDAIRFAVTVENNHIRLTATVDLNENYPIYEEFGTRFREGHFPFRQTMDFIAPRIREYLAEELARTSTAS
jgi:hypothetical protein